MLTPGSIELKNTQSKLIQEAGSTKQLALYWYSDISCTGYQIQCKQCRRKSATDQRESLAWLVGQEKFEIFLSQNNSLKTQSIAETRELKIAQARVVVDQKALNIAGR